MEWEVLGDDVEIYDFYTQDGYVEVNYEEVGGHAYSLSATSSITFTGQVLLDSTYGTIFPSYMNFKAPKIIISGMISIWNNGGNSITFVDSSVNFDDAEYDELVLSGYNYKGPIGFDGTSSINITSNTNGKTIIKANEVSGTITLDVQSGVNEGDTFSIEATTNNLVITDGDWTATPSTSGNITTYTLAKATLQKPKFRLLYTVG